jgi:O2-independent ubiquinone biosynthesis accessory factor UbiT
MTDSTAGARRDARQSMFDPRRLLRPWRGVIELLPPEPASLPLAQALNQMLLPRLDATTRAGLALRVIEVQFTDLGVRCRVALDAGGIAGFSPAPRHLTAAAHLSARSDDLWRLALGRTDIDTLMVQDALLIQAEPTDMMLIRQALAVLGPPRLRALLPPTPRQAIDALRSASIVARSLLPGGGRG